MLYQKKYTLDQFEHDYLNLVRAIPAEYQTFLIALINHNSYFNQTTNASRVGIEVAIAALEMALNSRTQIDGVYFKIDSYYVQHTAMTKIIVTIQYDDPASFTHLLITWC